MAIFVSNPTSAAVTTLSPDALDPSVMSPEEGFTEELAAAMQPSAAPTDALAKTPLDMPEEPGKKASDLQILPAEVLLNAVGDANFAFAGQAVAANAAAQNSVTGAVLADATETLAQDTPLLDLANQLQGAELAAANLAAQMSASAANVLVPIASNSSGVTAAIAVNATAGSGQEAAQASQAPVAGPSLKEGELASSATALASPQNTPSLVTESISTAMVSKGRVAQQLEGNASAASLAPAATSQAQLAPSVPSDVTRNLSQINASSTTKAVSTTDAPALQAMTAAASNHIKPDGIQAETFVKQATTANLVAPKAQAQVTLDPSLVLKSETGSIAANVSNVTVDASQTAAVKEAIPQSTPLAASSAVSSIDASIVSANSTTAAPVASPINPSSPTQSLVPTQSASEKTTVSSESKLEKQAPQAEESAFNFDAKLAKSDALQNPKALETAVSLAGVGKLNQPLQNTKGTTIVGKTGVQLASAAVATVANVSALANVATRSSDSSISAQDIAVSSAPELDQAFRSSSTSAQNLDASTSKNVQVGIRTERAGESFQVAGSSATANTAPANRLDSAALTAASPNSSVVAQEAPRAETTQSLEDISSSFVSSLVGGPQRPVTTVMDWISMQSQERPAPLVPHEVRLDAGAVQMEIQKMVKQGGGHVVMELTPPDQSKFTIELKLDERGNALLIVEGVSDSTKTRLEQSAPQLREQFQQMGLELQLDMRQQGQSSSSNAANFADAQERGSGDNNLASNGEGDTTKVLTQREAGANRARETGSNQVYLYA
jgi:hypothetical protein